MTFFDGSIDVVVAGALFAAGALSRRLSRPRVVVDEQQCHAFNEEHYTHPRCEAKADPRCGGNNCSAHCKKHCGKRCDV